MRSFQFVPPSGVRCHVVGAVYESRNPRELSEDMLDVELPNGIVICAGWYAYDRSNPGYFVNVLSAVGETLDRVPATSALDAIQSVRELTTLYSSAGPRPVASSNTVGTKYMWREVAA
jgi:hypothetical protein